MLGVFAVIFTLGFSLQGVTGGSSSGSKVGGRRTCHGSRERVNTRSSLVDDSSETGADRRLVLEGVAWMCLADVVIFWGRRVLPPSRIVCCDP